MKFSANLGFLWQELDLCEAFQAAAQAGFDAVECHWPYDVPAKDLAGALKKEGLPMIGLNTGPGDRSKGDFGLSALPERETEARGLIDQAIDYAAQIKCSSIHVMAGIAEYDSQALYTYQNNLVYACEKAAPFGMTILIETLNSRDVPGYFLNRLEDAVAVIKAVDQSNLKLMFDCYHVQIMQGDILTRLSNLLPYIGHIQIAAVPDRGEPDRGELNYPDIIRFIEQNGYKGYIGAEYRPRQSTQNGLGWFTRLKSSIGHPIST